MLNSSIEKGDCENYLFEDYRLKSGRATRELTLRKLFGGLTLFKRARPNLPANFLGLEANRWIGGLEWWPCYERLPRNIAVGMVFNLEKVFLSAVVKEASRRGAVWVKKIQSFFPENTVFDVFASQITVCILWLQTVQSRRKSQIPITLTYWSEPWSQRCVFSIWRSSS